MTPDDYARVLLTIVVFREARGDGPDAMRAVANVIRNRASKLQLGSDAEKLIKVITSKNQFSSMSVVGDSQTVVYPLATDYDYISSILNDTQPDNTLGAMFYANEAVVTSEWYKNNIENSPDHPITVKIGKQTFRK
jgi:spore germination cell wall hydrolase CwlJ-like protein